MCCSSSLNPPTLPDHVTRVYSWFYELAKYKMASTHAIIIIFIIIICICRDNVRWKPTRLFSWQQNFGHHSKGFSWKKLPKYGKMTSRFSHIRRQICIYARILTPQHICTFDLIRKIEQTACVEITRASNSLPINHQIHSGPWLVTLAYPIWGTHQQILRKFVRGFVRFYVDMVTAFLSFRQNTRFDAGYWAGHIFLCSKGKRSGPHNTLYIRKKLTIKLSWRAQISCDWRLILEQGEKTASVQFVTVIRSRCCEVVSLFIWLHKFWWCIV